MAYRKNSPPCPAKHIREQSFLLIYRLRVSSLLAQHSFAARAHDLLSFIR
jgi:hypothetical protein